MTEIDVTAPEEIRKFYQDDKDVDRIESIVEALSTDPDMTSNDWVLLRLMLVDKIRSEDFVDREIILLDRLDKYIADNHLFNEVFL